MMHPYPSQKSQRSRQMQFLGHLVLSHACHGSGSMFESRHGVSRPLRHRDRWRFLRALGIPVVFSGSTSDVALSPTHSWICLLPIKSKKKKNGRKKNRGNAPGMAFLGKILEPTESLLEGKPRCGPSSMHTSIKQKEQQNHLGISRSQYLGKISKENNVLAGWWARATPLKNMTSSIGMMTFPTKMGK